MGDFRLEAELPGNRPPPGWGDKKSWKKKVKSCLCREEDEEHSLSRSLPLVAITSEEARLG